jgi:hypothetical protein
MGRARYGRKQFRLAIFFLWESGARTCEMREAKWENVEWDKRVIRLQVHKTARATGADRVIPLNRKVFRLLTWMHRRRLPGQTHIFINSRGTPYTQDQFSELFRAYARIAGLPPGITAYSIRHSFVSRGLEAGVGERQIADLVGHTKTEMVSWYGRSVKEKTAYLQASLEKIIAAERDKKEQAPDGERPGEIKPFAEADRLVKHYRAIVRAIRLATRDHNKYGRESARAVRLVLMFMRFARVDVRTALAARWNGLEWRGNLRMAHGTTSVDVRRALPLLRRMVGKVDDANGNIFTVRGKPWNPLPFSNLLYKFARRARVPDMTTRAMLKGCFGTPGRNGG